MATGRTRILLVALAVFSTTIARAQLSYSWGNTAETILATVEANRRNGHSVP